MSRPGTLIGNALSVLTSDVVNRAATFILYALIARHLGATEVGQMALAFALFYALQVFASAGLRTIITRAVAKDRSTADHYLAGGTLLVIAASVVSVMALAGFVRLVGYSGDTASVVLLLGLALLPYSMSTVCEAIFQAFERMQYIAYAQVPVHLAKVGVAYALLVQGYGIYHVATLLLVSHAAVAGVEWWLMLRYVTRPRLETLRHVVRSSFTMGRAAATFLAIDGLIAINASLKIVLLSALATEKEVGLFSAASQLMVPVTLVYQSAVLSIFPTLCRRFDAGIGAVTSVLEKMMALLLAFAVPTAVGLFFLADSALLLLYGDRDFLLAAPVLRIMAWILIPTALTTVLGQVFLASVREKVTLRIVAVDALVGLVVGVILITKFGLIGAAIAAVVTRAVDFLQHYIPVSRLVPTIRLHELTWKPAVAVSCMALYLAAARNEWVILTAVSAGAVYLSVLLALVIWSVGGIRRLKAMSLAVWPK